MKRSLHIFIFILAFLSINACRSKGPNNPYLTAKKRPSEMQLEQDKKHLKKMKRKYERQKKRNRKFLFGRRTAPGT